MIIRIFLESALNLNTDFTEVGVDSDRDHQWRIRSRDFNPMQSATLHRLRALRKTLPDTSMISPCFFHALPKIAGAAPAVMTAVNNN
jgi:methylphosphotriester-DNA--protein-cysteine methyltransferase